MFSIGALARRSGVKVPTIRYYEQIGLIDPPDRSDGNQRRYEPAALDRLAFIRHARDLGLSIDSIRDLLVLSDHPKAPCDRADMIVEKELAGLRRRIARLQMLEKELARMAAACDAGTVADCYVLRAIGDHDLCSHDHRENEGAAFN